MVIVTRVYPYRAMQCGQRTRGNQCCMGSSLSWRAIVRHTAAATVRAVECCIFGQGGWIMDELFITGKTEPGGCFVYPRVLFCCLCMLCFRIKACFGLIFGTRSSAGTKVVSPSTS